jgi:hypothetical protein
MKDETETPTRSEDETPRTIEDETLAEEKETLKPPGWFRRNLRGFVIGVLASLVAYGLVTAAHRFFDHPPDKRVGEPVELGSFRYTVDNVTCGAKTFDEFTAYGKFCVATVDVVNISRDAGSPYPTSWILEGRRPELRPPGLDRPRLLSPLSGRGSGGRGGLRPSPRRRADGLGDPRHPPRELPRTI